MNDYAGLRGLFLDHFHQPFRRPLIPGFDAILHSATEAGALGSFLSGAGSTLMAVTLDRVEGDFRRDAGGGAAASASRTGPDSKGG